MSDPQILYLIGASTIPDWSKPKKLPSKIKDLVLYPEKYEFSDEVVTHDFDDVIFDLELGAVEIVSDDTMEVDDEVVIIDDIMEVDD